MGAVTSFLFGWCPKGGGVPPPAPWRTRGLAHVSSDAGALGLTISFVLRIQFPLFEFCSFRFRLGTAQGLRCLHAFGALLPWEPVATITALLGWVLSCLYYDFSFLFPVGAPSFA
jgi:hypothetical protein